MRALGIAAIVLAAGSSRRLGRPKQQELIAGETLLTRAVRTAQEAGLAPVIVIVSSQLDMRDLPAHAEYLVNNGAAEGMASSVRLGVQVAMRAGVRGTVLMTCDQPLLTSGHLQVLCAQPAKVMASGYAGRRGVPAYFPASHFEALLALQGDEGARNLLRDADVVIHEALALDIDTEDDLRIARERVP